MAIAGVRDVVCVFGAPAPATTLANAFLTAATGLWRGAPANHRHADKISRAASDRVNQRSRAGRSDGSTTSTTWEHKHSRR
jgi:hypothetical protein